MRDLTTYALECMEELDSIGIEYGNIIDFTVNTRAKKRWGQCKAVPGGYLININEALLNEKNSEDGLKNTIMHELLHSCEGCMNHGQKWKEVVGIVNRKLGYGIKTTSSSAEKGVLEETRNIKVKYRIVCKKCGNELTRSKMTKVVKYPSMYQCGKCHGDLKVFEV